MITIFNTNAIYFSFFRFLFRCSLPPASTHVCLIHFWSLLSRHRLCDWFLLKSQWFRRSWDICPKPALLGIRAGVLYRDGKKQLISCVIRIIIIIPGTNSLPSKSWSLSLIFSYSASAPFSSILFNRRMHGLWINSLSYNSSSLFNAKTFCKLVLSRCTFDNLKPNKSTTITKRRVRSICFKNLYPIPMFAWAPSINPGKSATVTCRKSLYSTTPIWGRIVVTGEWIWENVISFLYIERWYGVWHYMDMRQFSAMHSILLSRGYFCLHSGTPRVQRQQSISDPMWLHVLGHDVPGNCFPRNLHHRRQLRCIYRRHCSIRPLVYPRRWPLKRRLAPELLCLCLCVRANDSWNCLRHRRPQHIYFPCKKTDFDSWYITSVEQQWTVVHTFSWHFAEKRFLWQRNKHNRLGRRFHHISADHCLRARLWHSLGVCRWTAIASSYSRAANGIVLIIRTTAKTISIFHSYLPGSPCKNGAGKQKPFFLANDEMFWLHWPIYTRETRCQ